MGVFLESLLKIVTVQSVVEAAAAFAVLTHTMSGRITSNIVWVDAVVVVEVVCSSCGGGGGGSCCKCAAAAAAVAIARYLTSSPQLPRALSALVSLTDPPTVPSSHRPTVKYTTLDSRVFLLPLRSEV